MKARTHIKAGAMSLNHYETQVRACCRFSALIALVLVLAGCTHTRNAGFIGGGSYAEINRLGAGKEATVTLAVEPYMKVGGGGSMVTDQRDIQVSNLQMALDSTSWLNPRTGRFETVATARIREIRIVKTNHGRGALAGLGGGLLIGAAVGAGYGYALGDTTRDNSGIPTSCERPRREHDVGIPCTAGEKAAALAIIVGGLSGALGLIVGAAAGSEEIYRFKATPEK